MGTDNGHFEGILLHIAVKSIGDSGYQEVTINGTDYKTSMVETVEPLDPEVTN